MPGCSDLVGLVSLQHVFAIAVLVGKDGKGLAARLGRSAEGADGDLSAIGCEYFAEHRSTPAASLVMRTHGQEGAGGPTSLYDGLSGEQQVAVTLAKVRGE